MLIQKKSDRVICLMSRVPENCVFEAGSFVKKSLVAVVR